MDPYDLPPDRLCNATSAWVRANVTEQTQWDRFQADLARFGAPTPGVTPPPASDSGFAAYAAAAEGA